MGKGQTESDRPSVEQPVTDLLAAARDGDGWRALWDAVYRELREMARRQMAGEAAVRREHATSLVHEAFIRLTPSLKRPWTSRAEFFAAAANIMREIRVDDARRRKRRKRGGGRTPLSLADFGDGEPTLAGLFDDDPDEVLDVDEVLDRLAAIEPRMAQVVKLRYFAGLSVPEVAEALGIGPRSVDADWRAARAWLFQTLQVNEQSSE